MRSDKNSTVIIERDKKGRNKEETGKDRRKEHQKGEFASNCLKPKNERNTISSSLSLVNLEEL